MTFRAHFTEAGTATSRSPRRPQPSVGTAIRARQGSLTVAVAAIAVMLLPLRFQLANGITLGLLVAVALAPIWIPKLRLYRGGVTGVVLVLGCLMSGLWLTALAAADHQVAEYHIRMWIGLLLTFASTVGVVLWARQLMHGGAVAAFYGLGMLGSTLVNGFDTVNAWKFGYSMPLTIILLGLAWRSNRRSLELTCALGIAGISATNDSRSHFAMVLLSVALVLWQVITRARVGRRRGSATGAIIVLSAVIVAVYSLGQALILEGYLGEATQARSQEQIARSGSILLGGRPELGATWALFGHRPFGFGFGTKPTLEDINVAKTGMSTLGYDPNNGYVENYMFGDGIKLHSVTGDTWALFGIIGLALTAFMVWALVRRLTVDLSSATASALIAFLTARVLWDVAFGGFYGSLPILGIAVGVALLPRRPEQAVETSAESAVAPVSYR